MKVGIEAINVYGGQTFLDVKKLAQARKLDSDRFDNLLMKSKSMALNFEDPVSFGVNAAKPIIDQLSEEEKNKIELLIVSTESGIDFGKPISTYIHHYLGLSKNCRSFEVKHACYAGSAALQMAAGFILSNVSPGAKALVISTDLSRYDDAIDLDAIAQIFGFAEASAGAASLALLVSDRPKILELEQGAHGMHSYEVMDACRPTPGVEAVDIDLSLLSYLDCLENSFMNYQRKISDVDFQDHFNYLAFHTPFGGMVKGAHRTMMRKFKKVPPNVIEEDFKKRVEPSFTYCQQVGNVYSGTVFLALCGVIDTGNFDQSKRIGLFSYGSGCCSEFYSGIATQQSQNLLSKMQIQQKLSSRYELSMDEYEKIIMESCKMKFGIKDFEVDFNPFNYIYKSNFEGKNMLVLKRVRNYHREYEWA